MSLISIIIPILNEDENIPLLYERLKDLLKDTIHNFEFIFVDDGSTDDSFLILKKIALEDKKVKIIRFSRNFGSHAACLAGLIDAKGDACAFVSADMQDPPGLIHKLLEEWGNGYDIIIGLREEIEGSFNIFSKLYYFLVRRFALKSMPERGTDVFLIDRKVVNVISKIKEKNTSIFGLILWSGFTQKFVPYKRRERLKGITKWTFGKKVKLFIDTFVSFSYFPIRTISAIGIITAIVGFLYAIFILFNRLFFAHPIEGWASLMVALLVVAGIQMLMLGMLGEYLWRSFDESRNRPPFIIDQKIGFSEEDKPKSFY